MEEEPIPAPRARRGSIFDVGRKQLGLGAFTLSHADHSQQSMENDKLKVQYENTYHMEPNCMFPCGKVEAIMRKILDDNLTDKPYNPEGCANLCKEMSQEIKTQVMDLHLDRYKLVSLVTIGEKKTQLRLASRCLWDTKWDNFAAAEFESLELFATAVTYAIYFE